MAGVITSRRAPLALELGRRPTPDEVKQRAAQVREERSQRRTDPHGVHNIEPVSTAELMSTLAAMVEMDLASGDDVSAAMAGMLGGDERWSLTEEGRDAE